MKQLLWLVRRWTFSTDVFLILTVFFDLTAHLCTHPAICPCSLTCVSVSVCVFVYTFSTFFPPVLAAAVTQASLRSVLHKLLTAGPAFNVTALLSAAQHSNQGTTSSLFLTICYTNSFPFFFPPCSPCPHKVNMFLLTCCSYWILHVMRVNCVYCFRGL